MKSNILLVLIAVALAAVCATTAQAVVDVQFNLRYTHPADPNQGGSWDLLVQSNAANGLAGAVFILDGITGVTGINTPLSAITPGVFENVTSVFGFQPTGVGTEVKIIAADDLDGPLILGVGTGTGSPGNVPDDDLFPLPLSSSGWDDSALIASGTFGAPRPTIISVGANEFDSDPNDISLSAIGLVSVRGDSVSIDGLLPGDANRDGTVGAADVISLSDGFDDSSNPTGWNNGDFNTNGDTGPENVSALSGNFGLSATPPAIGSVPGPALPAQAGSFTVIPGTTAGGNELFEFFLNTTGDVGGFDTFELTIQSNNQFNQVGAVAAPVAQPSEDSGFSEFLTAAPSSGGFDLSAFGVIDTTSLVQATHASLGHNDASAQGNYLVAQVVMPPLRQGTYEFRFFDDGNEISSGGDTFGIPEPTTAALALAALCLAMSRRRAF